MIENVHSESDLKLRNSPVPACQQKSAHFCTVRNHKDVAGTALPCEKGRFCRSRNSVEDGWMAAALSILVAQFLNCVSDFGCCAQLRLRCPIPVSTLMLLWTTVAAGAVPHSPPCHVQTGVVKAVHAAFMVCNTIDSIGVTFCNRHAVAAGNPCHNGQRQQGEADKIHS